MRHNNRRMAARARVYTVPYQRLLYDPQSGERENIVSSAPRLGTRCKCDYTVMNPRAGIALMRPLRLAVSSITGVYARFHDSRINSHAEPGSLARFLDTDDNLPIKTLEFRDSEKSASEPSAGVYPPNAVSVIISRANPGVHPLTGGSGTKSRPQHN